MKGRRTSQELIVSPEELSSFDALPMKLPTFGQKSIEEEEEPEEPPKGFEAVRELVEEQIEEKPKVFQALEVVLDGEEDPIVQPAELNRLLRDSTRHSIVIDPSLPEVPESVDEDVGPEKKATIKQYSAPVDLEEEKLNIGICVSGRGSIVSPSEPILEIGDDDQQEPNLRLSKSGLSSSQRKLIVDEVEEETVLKNPEFSEVVEEVDEVDAETEAEKNEQVVRLSKNLKKTHDSFRVITKGDLVCSNLVPFAYTSRHSFVPNVDLIEEEPTS